MIPRALNAPLSWIDERSQGVGVASDEARAGHEPSQQAVSAVPVTIANADGVLAEAEAWLRAISSWLLANDHDMALPSGVLDTDPLDIADRLGEAKGAE